MIKVYAQEISDGLGEIIANNNSIAYLSLARESNRTKIKRPFEVSSASANLSQIDLFYMESILVSTGWNNNDDIFYPEELWPAKSTAEDKQFNFMHDEKDIFGHITGNYILDSEGNEVPYDSMFPDQVPKDFNIHVGSVIYTSWSDQKLAQRAKDLIEGIKEGKWFVSMECLFPNFDYELKSQAGEKKLISRSEATAYLSKYLRAYGGDGVYQGYSVGRVLRNITFSGMGLVNKPANPKSVITKIITNDEQATTQEVIATEEKSISGENTMSLDLTQELENVKAELAQARETIKSLDGFKSQAETLEGSVAQLKNDLQTLKDELAKAGLELTEAMKQKQDMESEMNKMKKEQKMAKRKAALVDAGLESEDLESTLASTESLEDEAFETIAAMMKKKAAKKMPEEDKSKASEENQETIQVVVEPEKTKASVNSVTDSGNETNLRQSVGDWFNQNVLKTLKS
jgi:hypothetical protein